MYKVQNETSTENISIQAIPPGGASVTVGGSSLDPAPFVSLSIDQFRVGDLIVGGVLIVSLNGTVYSENGGGFGDIVNQLKSRLDIGKKGDCILVDINCGGTVLVNGYGTIRSVSIDEGPDPTWTQIAAYSIEVEMYINNGELVVKPNAAANSYITNEIIRDLSESVTLNVDNEAFAIDVASGQKVGRAHAKYSFNISATGAAVSCKSNITQKTGLEAAEEVIKRRISAIADGSITSSLAAPPSLISALTTYHGGPKYMQVRSVDADPINGTMTVAGDIIIRPPGLAYPQAFVDISVDSRSDATQIGRTVTISGTIEGLYTENFSDLISSSFTSASANKIGNAEGVYGSIKDLGQSLASSLQENKLTDPCSQNSGNLTGICPATISISECSLRLVSRTATRNFGQGTISFSDEYSTAPNCNIPGAAKVESEVSHTFPTDVFAEFTIPFRGEPLLQNLETKTKETVTVTVTATVDAGCSKADLSGLGGCLSQEVERLAVDEGVVVGPNGWYVTQDSYTKTNTGNFRVTTEYTRPYNCANGI
jgi:hypothetical protein